jgi:hypothetical protein
MDFSPDEGDGGVRLWVGGWVGGWMGGWAGGRLGGCTTSPSPPHCCTAVHRVLMRVYILIFCVLCARGVPLEERLPRTTRSFAPDAGRVRRVGPFVLLSPPPPSPARSVPRVQGAPRPPPPPPPPPPTVRLPLTLSRARSQMKMSRLWLWASTSRAV